MNNIETLDYIIFLRGLADRMIQIPAIYGTDQSDIDDLLALANYLEKSLK